jgi:hypothetical protein
MQISDTIEELKELPPLTQQVCGTCHFFREYQAMSMKCYSKCVATGGEYASIVWPRCQGRMWQPCLPRVSLFARLKRWLTR